MWLREWIALSSGKELPYQYYGSGSDHWFEQKSVFTHQCLIFYFECLGLNVYVFFKVYSSVSDPDPDFDPDPGFKSADPSINKLMGSK